MCLLTPTEDPGCSYVTQFICRVGWGRESSASFIRSPLFWVASKLLPGARWPPGPTLTLCLDCSLTLIDSSLPSEAEPELRMYISRRLSKGALLGGMGNIATVELRYWSHKLAAPDHVLTSILFAWCFKSDISIDTSRNVDYNKIDCTGNWDPELREWAGWLLQNCQIFALPSIPEQAVGCYCCLVEQERSPDQPDADGNGYVICFMGGSEKGLNLYPLHSRLMPSASFKPPLFIRVALKLLFIYFLAIQNFQTRTFFVLFSHIVSLCRETDNRFFLDPLYI